MNRYGNTDYDDKQFTILNDFMSQSLLSLKDALDPLVDQIRHLNRYINVAKSDCFYPSTHDLTHDESAAIYIYTMEWGEQSVYRMVNNALRKKDSKVLKPWYKYLKLFTTAILKVPTYKGNVWRGENHSVAQSFQKNQKCVWWTITSSSITTDVMDDFIEDRGTLFSIEVKNGRNIIGYSCHPQEEEIILLPGTSVRALNSPFQDCSGMYVVSLKVVNENVLLRDYGVSHLNSSASNILDIRSARSSVTNDRQSPVRNNRIPSARREQHSSVGKDLPRRNRVDKPSLPTQESREQLFCGGHACRNCQKCCDWKWNHRSNDWNRASDASCRGLYTVDENKHYVRGVGGGRGGGGIYPICECDM